MEKIKTRLSGFDVFLEIISGYGEWGLNDFTSVSDITESRCKAAEEEG